MTSTASKVTNRTYTGFEIYPLSRPYVPTSGSTQKRHLKIKHGKFNLLKKGFALQDILVNDDSIVPPAQLGPGSLMGTYTFSYDVPEAPASESGTRSFFFNQISLGSSVGPGQSSPITILVEFFYNGQNCAQGVNGKTCSPNNRRDISLSYDSDSLSNNDYNQDIVSTIRSIDNHTSADSFTDSYTPTPGVTEFINSQIADYLYKCFGTWGESNQLFIFPFLAGSSYASRLPALYNQNGLSSRLPAVYNMVMHYEPFATTPVIGCYFTLSPEAFTLTVFIENSDLSYYKLLLPYGFTYTDYIGMLEGILPLGYFIRISPSTEEVLDRGLATLLHDQFSTLTNAQQLAIQPLLARFYDSTELALLYANVILPPL